MKTVFRAARRNRILDIVLFAAIVLSIVALLRFLPGPDPIEVSGTAQIIDGDSLVVRGVEVRLRGVDAPERAQSCSRSDAEWPCGEEAAGNLRRLLRSRIVTCRGNQRDAHDRLLAVCRSGGREVNRWLVEQGWAVSYHDYPSAERDARSAKRGLWSGTFVRPGDWREENR